MKKYTGTTIQAGNAPIGSGKSTATNKIIDPNDLTLIALPTRESVDETTEHYQNFHGYSPIVIYSKGKGFNNGVDKPSEHLIDAIQKQKPQIRTTHESLFRIGEVLGAQSYNLIVDEAPTVSHFYNENLSDLTKIDDLYLITSEYQEYQEVDNEGKALLDKDGKPITSRTNRIIVNPEAKERIERYLTEGNPINKHRHFYSSVSNSIYKMLYFLANDAYECWIPDTYGKYNERTKKTDYNFRMLAILKPNFFDQFKNVKVLSAELDSTEFYIMYEALGVDFTKEDMHGLRYDILENQNITFHYQKDLLRYSKNQKIKKNKQGERFGDLLITGINHYIHSRKDIDNKLYFTSNRFDRSTYKNILGSDAYETTTRVHSLNNLQDYKTIIYPVCMNLSPFERAVYRRLGIDHERIENARNVLNAYQYIRGANRKENPEHVDVFVPSKFLAKELQNLFGDSDIKECSFMSDEQLMSFVDVDKRKNNTSHKPKLWIEELPRGTKRNRVKSYAEAMGLTSIPSPENQKDILDQVIHLKKKDFDALILGIQKTGNNGFTEE